MVLIWIGLLFCYLCLQYFLVFHYSSHKSYIALFLFSACKWLWGAEKQKFNFWPVVVVAANAWCSQCQDHWMPPWIRNHTLFAQWILQKGSHANVCDNGRLHKTYSTLLDRNGHLDKCAWKWNSCSFPLNTPVILPLLQCFNSAVVDYYGLVQ